MENIYVLPKDMIIDLNKQAMIEEDYKRFSEEGLCKDIESYILERYSIDISSSYADRKIRNPFGIASGQLSCNINQVKNSIDSGIGFIVLKTVISEDPCGNSMMEQWKVEAPKMVVEKIKSARGEEGYTVTWKGRGWTKSFKEYLEFMEEALAYGKEKNVVVIPSCKFNLPKDLEEAFNIEEYKYTLKELLSSWKNVMGKEKLILEKDFSPTLAGSDISKSKNSIIRWIKEVPSIIKEITGEDNIVLGLKLNNTVFEDEFQTEMLKEAFNNKKIDYLICFNRLFDVNKSFEGKVGVAYGGYDLSDRNLKILTEIRRENYNLDKNIPISATGNIESGKMMIEYALRGCENGQIHTFFQVPAENFGLKKGHRVERALNELLFNPEKGLIKAMLYLEEKSIIKALDGILRFNDINIAYDEIRDWGKEI